MKKHYDEKNIDKCLKCYKCVRNCPTKAIKATDDTVIEQDELCINCGKCGDVCKQNVHYKKIDFTELDNFLKNNKVVALLDSTCFLHINEYSINQIDEAILKTGFFAVEHDFEGMVIYDYIVDKTFNEDKDKFYFNSNCVPFIDYVRKYYPELTDNLLPYITSTEISAKLKKEKYGKDVKVLLITNCYGDFTFTDTSEYIDFCMLGNEIKEYLDYKNIKFSDFKDNKEKLESFGVKNFSAIAPSTISGCKSCSNVLNYAKKSNPKIDSPLRFFWCNGNCFNSSGIVDNSEPFEREQKYFKFLEDNFIFKEMDKDIEYYFGDLDRFKKNIKPSPVIIKEYKEDVIVNVLKNIKINDSKEELNCKACGYRSCRDFATAILNDMAMPKQCVPYLMKVNKQQSDEMYKMINELNEAFSLTIPDENLEKKLKTTPSYRGIYDIATDYLEITGVIDGGLYHHTITCLKIASDLKNNNVFHLIGINKNTLVKAILLHANAKTQPILCTGDVIKYSALFEDKKIESSRSATFAEKYYGAEPDVCTIIKYQKHSEDELPDNFPKYLLPCYRLFKVIDLISSVMIKSETKLAINFEFTDFILYINKKNEDKINTFSIDLYRSQDMTAFGEFLI